MKRALFALVLAGCAAPTQVAPHATTPAPTWSAGTTPRLGWVAWQDGALVACDRRIDDEGHTTGALGPCRRFAPDGAAAPIPPPAATPEGRAADAAPFSGCRLALEELQLVPKTVPARAWLVDGAGRRMKLAEWTPDPSVPGDRFFLEASFSPDAKTMALVEVAVGVGEGERTIEIAGAKLGPAPACR